MTDLLEITSSYSSLSGKIYALLRWLMCPFPDMERSLPKQGKVFDLGCGKGVFAQYLARTSKRRQVIGVDVDGRKISLARKAGEQLKNLKYKNSDIFTVDLERATGIVLSDFLHHLPFKRQEKLLQLVSEKLKNGGVLVIKEINSKDFIRSKLSRFWDYVFYPKDKIFYRDLSKVKRKLENLGFSVKLIRREVRYFPGSTNLLICRKTDKRS